MKRYYSTIVLVLAALMAQGSPLTPDQALQRLRTATPTQRMASSPLHLVYTGQETREPAYYVFSNDAQTGYIIAGADDLQAPVLGYSNEGSFTYSELPEQMKGWLEFYSAELEYARKLPKVDQSRYEIGKRPERAPIAPLVHSIWNQGNPFNLLCPTYSGTKTVTGCVATAMAQVMRKWKHPLQGVGSYSYSDNGNEQSFNFGETTFDWPNMLLSYQGDYTQDQADAVAVLMRACGVSVDMSYGSSSGAVTAKVIPSLINYFKYAKSSAWYQRNFFGIYEWENLVYSSLQNECPVLYSGQGSNGGHAFVVDGYDTDGYFHLNWGWAGASDGYFLLTALDPTTLGIGGGGGGFNYSQGAGINIRPDYEGAEPVYVLGYAEPFTAALNGTTLIFTGFCGNYGAMTIPAVVYQLRLVGENGKTYTYNGQTSSNLRQFYGYNSHSFSLASSRPDAGTYEIEECYLVRANGKDSVYNTYMPPSMRGKFTLVVPASGDMELKTREELPLKIEDFRATTPLFKTTNFGLAAKMTNENPVEYFEKLYIGWYNNSTDALIGVGDPLTVNIRAGETIDKEWIIAVPSTVKKGTSSYFINNGTYKICLLRQTNTDASSPTYEDVSAKISVTVQNKQSSVVLTASNLKIENSSAVDANDIKFSLDVTAKTGYYLSPLYYWVRQNGTSLLSATTTSLALPEGESQKVEWRFPFHAGKKDVTYNLILNYKGPSSNVYLTEANFVVGTVGVDAVGLDEGLFGILTMGDNALVSAPAAITALDVYSLQGIHMAAPAAIDGSNAQIDIAALPSGIYLVRVISEAGVKTFRFVKQ